MKRYISFVLCLLSISLAGYAQDYYYYRDEKIPLQRGNQQYIIFQDDLLSEADKAKLVKSEDVSLPGMSNLKWGYTKPDAVLEDTEHVLYSTPSYKTGRERDMFVTHRFYVQLKKESDLAILQNMAEQYHADIEEPGALALWYILRWGVGCQYNALELANIFHESGLFSAAEPEFIHNVSFAEESATPQINAEYPANIKYIHNGQLYILRDGKTYNVTGQKIAQ